jgi:hypothetical protein
LVGLAETMKVIFWDIDGVLNTPQTWGAWSRLGWPESIEPELAARARQLHLDTGAKAVLCSTWRLNHKVMGGLSLAGYEGTVDCLKQRGWPDAAKYFIGATPYLKGCQRGQEISLWLARHPKVDVFAIVDDATDMLGVAHRHVQTNFTLGVTDEDCAAVKALLA